MVVSDLTPAHLENYKQKRLADVSCRGTLMRPATINRELAYLHAMLNVFVQMGRLESNPVEKIKRLPEHNVRERVLGQAEFDRLLEACPDHLKPVVLTAWYTAMRASEIIKLRWSEVDLVTGIIRLSGARTKNKTGRIVPLHPRLLAIFKELPSRFFGERVFVLPNGRAFNNYRKGYSAAVARAGLGDFTFHDLRHCAINNLRLAGNDHFAIMAMSGHKTDSAFKRYNLVTEEELKGIKWKDLTDSVLTMGKVRGEKG
ncbi:MAG: site-specific integrase [Deltaproteobacteria bacterium]|nr:site-specific integrase [Deltaproteobacteria bacterium]